MRSRSPSRVWKSTCGLANERVERLEEQRKNVQGSVCPFGRDSRRVQQSGRHRAHRGEILKTAQQELAEARAGQAEPTPPV